MSRDVRALAAAIREKQGTVASLIAGGKSLNDAGKAFGIQTAPAQPGRMAFPGMIEVLCLEFTEEK